MKKTNTFNVAKYAHSFSFATAEEIERLYTVMNNAWIQYHNPALDEVEEVMRRIRQDAESVRKCIATKTSY